MESRIGELAALATAFCWTITALSFESAGKRVGSLTVNITRLIIAAVVFAVYGWIARGRALPLDLPATAWVWLSLSGLVGFVVGDLFLFQAFVDVGARISMLIYASVPPLTAIMAWFVLGEKLTTSGVIGMCLTIAGIAVVVLKAPSKIPIPANPQAHGLPVAPFADPEAEAQSQPRKQENRNRARGALLAFGGALGQAGGLVLGRYGAGTSLDPFAATQIRVFAGILGFSVLFSVLRKWRNVGSALGNGGAMARISAGALFGPFLGVSLGLFAAQHTSTGVASTLMALVPVLIIVPSVVLFKERVSVREVLGAIVAVIGVGVLFL
jgi:drug/metabolite transporter (DMT)-like permease